MRCKRKEASFFMTTRKSRSSQKTTGKGSSSHSLPRRVMVVLPFCLDEIVGLQEFMGALIFLKTNSIFLVTPLTSCSLVISDSGN